MNESQDKFRTTSFQMDMPAGILPRSSRLESFGKKVTDWFYNRSRGLFTEQEDLTADYPMTKSNIIALMQTGATVEWSLDQGVGDIIEANLRSSARFLVPPAVAAFLKKLYRYIYVILLTDEVLDQEESDQASIEQLKKGFIREAGQKVINTAMILGFKAKPVFFGFLGIYRKVTRKVKSVVADVLGSAFRNFLRKAVFHFVSIFKPRISHIRGPDS